MFNGLIGNEHVKQAVARLIQSGRMPNSMLFAGDEGIGKRLFALEIAKAFVCLDPRESLACDACPACRRVGKFTFPTSEKGDDFDQVFFSEHPDVGIVIPYKRNVRIGAIRNLEKEANYNPYEARARIFIIDDCEKMADPAANALLKTLEEPPATSHIFLITSRPDSLLSTIRSRCQMLRFAPVPTGEIERFLIAERDRTSEEASLAAHVARGSVGRAVSANVEQFRARRDKMAGVLENAIVTRDLAALLRTAEEMNDAKNKDHFEDHLDILQALIHDIWTIATSGDTVRVVNTDITRELARLASMSGGRDLPRWIADIETMRQNFAVNINRKIAADALFVSMAAL